MIGQQRAAPCGSGAGGESAFANGGGFFGPEDRLAQTIGDLIQAQALRRELRNWASAMLPDGAADEQMGEEERTAAFALTFRSCIQCGSGVSDGQ